MPLFICLSLVAISSQIAQDTGQVPSSSSSQPLLRAGYDGVARALDQRDERDERELDRFVP
jgi:hypothetical protein